jgi:phosphatidylethanolamine/phosphatidyl-N-methylethanolamine N-methyltransferase
LFFAQSLRSLSVTASLFPSSRSLATALLRRVDFGRARVVVELGMGTGAITTEILKRMRPDAVLYGVDLNPVFVSHLQRTIQDLRFVPILGRAEHLAALLDRHGIRHAHAIVSSLGLTSMRPRQRSAIVKQVTERLTDGGVLTQFQYVHASGHPNWLSALGVKRFPEKAFLEAHFRDVNAERVIWNLPPANVYTCRV